jgi:hypothetical protein
LLNAAYETTFFTQCISTIKLAGNITKINNDVFIEPVSSEYLKSFMFENSAKLLAKQHNTYIVLAPINLFSDKTSGTLSSRFSKYENTTFHSANLPFHERSLLENHHLISTACSVNDKEQMPAIKNELLQLEQGIVGIDGLTGIKVIIVSPISAFLVTISANPRYALLEVLRQEQIAENV